MNFIAGDSLLRLEEPEKAVPYLRAALAADPKLLAADASLGLALSRLGKNAEAVPHLQKALELDEDGSLHYQLARAYQAAGEAEKAPRDHGRISGDPQAQPGAEGRGGARGADRAAAIAPMKRLISAGCRDSRADRRDPRWPRVRRRSAFARSPPQAGVCLRAGEQPHRSTST